MRRRTRALAASLIGGCLAFFPLAAATAEEPPQQQQESPGAMAREGLEQMMRALRLLVEKIPQYELPEMLDNGDIIIRRKRAGDAPEDPEFDETAT